MEYDHFQSILFGTCTSEEVIQAIDEGRFNVNEKNPHGLTPLMMSVGSTRRMDIAKILLERGADPNEKDMFSRPVLFHALEIHQNEDMMELLLQNGADVNARNVTQSTVIFFAKEKRILSCLLSYGADATIENQFGHTALDHARTICSDTNQKEVIDPLIEHCATLRFDKQRLLLHRVLRLDSYSWCKDIEKIVNVNPTAMIEEDPVTGLLPFLLAAVRKSDLDSGFELMRRTPTYL